MTDGVTNLLDSNHAAICLLESHRSALPPIRQAILVKTPKPVTRQNHIRMGIHVGTLDFYFFEIARHRPHPEKPRKAAWPKPNPHCVHWRHQRSAPEIISLIQPGSNADSASAEVSRAITAGIVHQNHFSRTPCLGGHGGNGAFNSPCTPVAGNNNRNRGFVSHAPRNP